MLFKYINDLEKYIPKEIISLIGIFSLGIFILVPKLFIASVLSIGTLVFLSINLFYVIKLIIESYIKL